jgi:hypothetical protein
MHIATCKVMYHEYAFGPGWDTLETPHDAASGVRMLEDGHRLLSDDLASLGDAGLDGARATNWREPWPAWRIFNPDDRARPPPRSGDRRPTRSIELWPAGYRRRLDRLDPWSAR